jgi:hypothetical protein
MKLLYTTLKSSRNVSDAFEEPMEQKNEKKKTEERRLLNVL